VAVENLETLFRSVGRWRSYADHLPETMAAFPAQPKVKA
jgi:hypothetical protein